MPLSVSLCFCVCLFAFFVCFVACVADTLNLLYTDTWAGLTTSACSLSFFLVHLAKRAWLKARDRRGTFFSRACTPLTKSKEKERLLAVYGSAATQAVCFVVSRCLKFVSTSSLLLGCVSYEMIWIRICDPSSLGSCSISGAEESLSR